MSAEDSKSGWADRPLEYVDLTFTLHVKNYAYVTALVPQPIAKELTKYSGGNLTIWSDYPEGSIENALVELLNSMDDYGMEWEENYGDPEEGEIEVDAVSHTDWKPHTKEDVKVWEELFRNIEKEYFVVYKSTCYKVKAVNPVEALRTTKAHVGASVYNTADCLLVCETKNVSVVPPDHTVISRY